MDDDRIERRSGRLRSFVIGGVVGASAAIAAARRVRPRPRRRPTPAGLAAFEEAPCYRETVELEERLARERRQVVQPRSAQPQPRSRPSSS